jgi:hypothetical protein
MNYWVLMWGAVAMCLLGFIAAYTGGRGGEALCAGGLVLFILAGAVIFNEEKK